MPKGRPSLKGRFLLDGGKLHGSAFHRTVVLVCTHDAAGAFGLVLNRPSDAELADAFDQDLPEAIRSETLSRGGPVQPSALSYLHSDALMTDGNVLPDLSVGHDLGELLELGGSWSSSRKLRVFAGYAGWSSGQLDDEMRRGAWLTHPATSELVFRVPPEELWHHLLRLRDRWPERLLADAPDDLSWN